VVYGVVVHFGGIISVRSELGVGSQFDDLVSMTDSGSALSLFQTDPTGFDLSVTDQTMPNFSGLEMAQEMLSLRSDLPIILISGFSSKATESELQRIGIKATLSKPVPIVKLANTVRSLLDSV